jgi:hypothetical protein
LFNIYWWPGAALFRLFYGETLWRGLAICIAAASASCWLPSAMHACGVFLSAQREKESERPFLRPS